MGGSYRDLIAWKKSIALVIEVYQQTEHFPQREMYGLTSQLRRAAVSVPSNIAEGQARYSKVEFRRFLRNSRGSLAEIETQITIAHELGFIDKENTERLLGQTDTISRIISGLIAKISKDLAARTAEPGSS